ncbi:MAG: YciI family protein [Vallitalea sp.]|jgi:uncharacterized protein YciI|nr:YciI family protein [Vallitalea sp.]
MFVLVLEYIKSLDEIDKELQAHIKYLDKYYEQKKFICSGRRNPRVGGVIICNANDKQEVESIIKEDPFYINKLAKYNIIEFSPTKYGEGFENLIIT